MGSSKSGSGSSSRDAEPKGARAIAPVAQDDARESLWAPVKPADSAAAFRTACRLFRGFDLLPETTLDSLRGFPHFFVARRGALSLREREIIARAITGEPPGSFGGDPRALEDEAHRASRSLEAVPELSGREQQLADFASPSVGRRSRSTSVDAAAFDLLTRVPVRFHRRQKAFERLVVSPVVELRDAEVFRIRSSYFTMAPHRVPFAEMRGWYRAYKAFADLVSDPRHHDRFRLESGDFLIYDNHRMLHSRTSFEGPRWVRGVYLDRAVPATNEGRGANSEKSA